MKKFILPAFLIISTVFIFGCASILQTTPFDEAIFEEEFKLLVETKRPRVRQIFFPGLRRHLGGIKLCEPAFFVRAGAGDFDQAGADAAQNEAKKSAAQVGANRPIFAGNKVYAYGLLFVNFKAYRVNP